MTANHVEHEIATFPGSPGRARPYALIGIEEMASILPNGNRKFHLFESREALDDYLRGIDGEADVVRLVQSPSS